MRDHIMAHEMMMMEQAQKNPIYMQLLATLPQFPMFMEMPLMALLT